MQKTVFDPSDKPKADLAKFMKISVAFSLGFFCCGAKILGSYYSLGVCVCALSGSFSPFGILGMLSYMLLSGCFYDCFAKLCSAFLAALLIPFVKKYRYFNPLVISIGCCIIMLLVNLAEAVGRGFGSYQLAFNMIDAVICGCIIFMFSSLADEYAVTKKLNISGISGFFSAVLYIVFVSALTSVPFSLDLGRIFATVVLLYFSKKYRAVGGAVIGVLTACGTALCTPSLVSNTLIMSSSGLIAGALFSLSDLAAIAAYVISTLISLTAIGVNSDTFVMFWDIIIGVVISIIIPNDFFKIGRSFFTTAKSTVDLVGETASSRLGYAAKTISEVRRDISVISVKIEDRHKPLSLSQRVEKTVCSKCECYELCRRSRECDLKNCLTILENISKSYGTVTDEDVSNFLPCCNKIPIIENAFVKAADELAFENANDVGVVRMRELLCEQLLSMEELLNDMSSRVSRIKEVDELLSQRAGELFDVSGFKGARVCVYTNENRRRFVEAFINDGYKGDLVRLTVKLSDIVGCDMEMPSINVIGRITRLVFTEKPDIEANIATFQASCMGGEYCGDTVDTVTINESERYVILSDGMGTGERARLDSLFTVSLVRRLVSSGISMSCAQRLINSALSVKSRDESFSTLDVLKLDLFSHTASFLKAGAAASYILREGSIIKISGSSLPAGILTRCDPDVISDKIAAGDMIIITSDGIDEELLMNNKELCSKLSDSSPDKASKLLGELAVENNKNHVNDDITVAAVKICHCVV